MLAVCLSCVYTCGACTVCVCVCVCVRVGVDVCVCVCTRNCMHMFVCLHAVQLTCVLDMCNSPSIMEVGQWFELGRQPHEFF